MSFRGRKVPVYVPINDPPYGIFTSSSNVSWVASIVAVFLMAGTALLIAGLGWYQYNPNPTFDSVTIHGDANIGGALNYSVAPTFIVVGPGKEGVEDWPTSIINAKRTVEQFFPVSPSFFPTIPLPPAGAVYVNTIAEATQLLQNKVITNTTILLRAGDYEENAVFDGFVSNCDASGSQIMDGTNKCHGLNVIGDARIVMGRSFVHGQMYDLLSHSSSLFGGDVAVCELSCLNSTTIAVAKLTGATSSNPVSDIIVDPQFDTLGVVAGDKIVIGNGKTRVWVEKTVVSVVGNVIQFNETGCNIDGMGSSVTFLPNRRIIAQAPLVVDDLNKEEQFSTVPAALNIQAEINLVGVHVTVPEDTPQTFSMNMNYLCLVAASAYLDGLVCNARGNTLRYDDAFRATARVNGHGTSSPNAFQDYENEISTNVTGLSPRRGNWGSITVLNGDANFLHSGSSLTEVTILGGTFIATDSARVFVLSLTAISKGTSPYAWYACQIYTHANVFAHSLMALSSGVWGIRMRYGSSLTTYNHVKISTGNATGYHCVSMLDTTRFSVVDATGGVGQYLLANSFEFINCPRGALEIKNAAVFHSDLPFAFTNTSNNKDYIESGATVVLRGRKTNYKRDPFLRYTTSSLSYYHHLFEEDWNIHKLDCPAGCELLFQIYNFERMADREFTVYSANNNPYTLRISSGGTWDGANTKVNLSGLGSGITFRVFSATPLVIRIISTFGNVAFAP